jgi:hypothetical protein
MCGRLWATVDPERKLMFDDPDFLDSLPNPYLTSNMEAEGDKANSPASAHQDESSYTTLTVLRHRVKFDAHEWLQKVIRDVSFSFQCYLHHLKAHSSCFFLFIQCYIGKMRNLSTAFQVAGFVVITSRNKKGPVAISGGTIVGERFLDLHAKTIDPCANFVAYQEGQAVIKTISGLDLSQEKQLPKKSQAARKEKYAGPHSQGGLPENRAAVAKQLGQALSELIAFCFWFDSFLLTHRKFTHIRYCYGR